MAGPARAPRRYARGMCGRYTLTQQGQLVADLELALDHPVAGPVREDGADAAELAWWRPRWNIAPTQPAPVVLLEDGARVLHLLRWGLVPHWAKDLRVGASMINARAETVFDKPAFRDAIRRRRCLVPADGFYEWLRPDGPRGRALPQYIAPPAGSPRQNSPLCTSTRTAPRKSRCFRSANNARSDSMRGRTSCGGP